VIPGGKEIDLKKAAAISGNKKAAMIKMKELEPLTGYIRGGCSPIGMKKDYPVYMDDSAFEHSSIYISAGIRGLQLKMNPTDLAKVCKATKASISTDKLTVD
jgi:Cys-tRNA(Pro)/Cys-tRNA(Cys) deacylase